MLTSEARVLVVDDDVDTAERTAMLFKVEGIHADTAYDGPSAIDRAQSHPPDVILLDLAMPRSNGYEVIENLRRRLSQPPFVVAISGYGQPSVKRRCLEAGFDMHLTKPVDAEMVLRLLALLREGTAIRKASHDLLARTAALRTQLLQTFIESAGHLVDLAAITRNATTRQRCWERARKLRELVAKNLEANASTTTEFLRQLILNDALDQALSFEAAPMGNIQLVDSAGRLEIVAQRGFDSEVMHHFGSVSEEDTSTSARALRYRTTIAVEDVQTDARHIEHRAAAAAADYRAVCSSPLIVPDGRVLGVLSTHFAEPHVFSFPEVEAHGHHARHTAALVNWASARSSALAVEKGNNPSQPRA